MPCPMRLGPPPRMTIFSRVGGPRLADRLAGEGRLVRRIHIGGRRGELRRAGVDALVDRRDAARPARLRHVRLRDARQRRQPQIGESGRLEGAQIGGVVRQAKPANLGLQRDDFPDARQKPWIDPAHVVNFLDAHAGADRLRDIEQAVWGRFADRRAQRVVVVALAEALDLDLVEPGQAGLQRAQRFLQGFGERAPDRHRLADRFHRRGQDGVGAGKFLEREARDFGDDVIDRRLE